MRPKPISKEALRKALAKTGITEAPPDHPVYSEGASIILVSRSPSPAKPRVVTPGFDDPTETIADKQG